MDLAQATGAAEAIDLAGEPHAVRLLTMREWGELTAWLKRAQPSPLTRAAIAIQEAEDLGQPLSAANQDALLDHAARASLAWPPRLGSKEWLDAFDASEGGQAQFVFHVLRHADPSITLDRVERLVPRMRSGDFAELLRVALYGTHPAPKS
jgi:hypothetical protein